MLKRFKIFLAMFFATLTSAEAAEQGLRVLKRAGDKIYYTGSITVSGNYQRWTDDVSLEVMGDVLCFSPEGESAKLIPREHGDSRIPWFCFSNQNEAKKLLNASDDPAKGFCGHGGKAKIFISGYVVDRNESEVYDEAKLEHVVSATPPKPLKCN